MEYNEDNIKGMEIQEGKWDKGMGTHGGNNSIDKITGRKQNMQNALEGRTKTKGFRKCLLLNETKNESQLQSR